ncbi:telomeric repeat-binding factor 2 isoform X1 [Malaclemys terrapin pileata]|uniref:telomeric repeat-binding factor 2 isoform X1 n=1 Tax=Malaclemys terrapin pileata TaxID=2991368 RepID=UPI0023A8B0E8|nr:telomeric repeat-binding factor 2 isoform X1 [Malaclemys terrapin pileata]
MRVTSGSWRGMAGGRGRVSRSRRGPMAAGKGALGLRAPEEAVNRWVLQFYFHQAVGAYRARRNRDFREFRDVMQALLLRPLVKEPAISRLLRIMQFLSRIEEGENLDCTFDTESELTPLESAIGVLELIEREFPVSEVAMESVRKMVKQAAVIICIKKREFDKASKILKKNMAKDPSTQKLRTELLSIIREKNLSHTMIRNFSYKTFQQSAFQFLETYLEDSEPFLLTMAKKTLNSEYIDETKKLALVPEPVEVVAPKPVEVAKQPPVAAPDSVEVAKQPPAAAPDSVEVAKQPPAAAPDSVEVAKQPPAVAPDSVEMSSNDFERQPPGTVTTYGISALREAFKTLSNSQDSDAAFTKLDETDFSFPKQLSPSVSHRLKRQREEENPPLETSDTPKSPPKSKRLFTISRLIMEQDSQSTELSETPDSSQEPVVSSAFRTLVQKPHVQRVSSRSPKPLKARWNTSNGQEEKDTWSEEDELFLDKKSPGRNSHSSSILGSKKQRWTVQESEWIREGVKKFGEGNWKIICKKFPFENRTSVMIKDRWRTMKKLGLH